MLTGSQRLARPPDTASVAELLMHGLLCESEIRQDGTVSEQSRLLAQMRYEQIRQTTYHRVRRRMNRSQPLTEAQEAQNSRSSMTRPRSATSHLSQSETSTSVRPASAHARIEGSEVDALKCCICLNSDRMFALSPCFHFCVCETCVLRISQCPLCRRPIDNVHRIWL